MYVPFWMWERSSKGIRIFSRSPLRARAQFKGGVFARPFLSYRQGVAWNILPNCALALKGGLENICIKGSIFWYSKRDIFS